MVSTKGGISRTSLQDYSRNPRVTYMLITGIVVLIGILHLLPSTTQQDLATLLTTHSWLVGVILVVVLGITYFNWIAGLLMLFLAICVLFPLTLCKPSTANNGVPATVNEGFAGRADNDISLNNRHIKSLFEPGLLGKGIDEARAANKRIKSENAAREKSIQVMNSKRAEKFGDKNTGRKRENFKEIELRRFDPTSEDDMNLLLTMEHCADIQNRIKYVYEDNKYLKKYIRDKLEDIVDLLDLVPDDSAS